MQITWVIMLFVNQIVEVRVSVTQDQTLININFLFRTDKVDSLE